MQYIKTALSGKATLIPVHLIYVRDGGTANTHFATILKGKWCKICGLKVLVHRNNARIPTSTKYC